MVFFFFLCLTVRTAKRSTGNTSITKNVTYVKLVAADATLAHRQVIVIDFESFTTNIIVYELF